MRVASLCLETTQGQKSTSKLAKKLLSSNSQDLLLWHFFSLIEIQFGRLDSARKIILSTLSQLKDGCESSIAQSSMFWKTWIDLEVQQERSSSALFILIQAVRNEFRGFQNSSSDEIQKMERMISSNFDQDAQIGADETLRTKRYFDQKSSKDSSALVKDIDSDLIELPYFRVVFTFLTNKNGNSIDETSQMIFEYVNLIKEQDNQLQRCSSRREKLFMGLICFLGSIISKSNTSNKVISFKPLIVRNLLTELISLYPQNSIFISILGSHESKFKIENHFRLTIGKALAFANASSGNEAQSPNLIQAFRKGKVVELSSLYLIFVELNLNNDRFSQFSVRKLFEKAVETER